MNSNALKLLAPSLMVRTTVSILEAEAPALTASISFALPLLGAWLCMASLAGVDGHAMIASVQTMLRIHFVQQWFGLSERAM
jgi:hypothetical protein